MLRLNRDVGCEIIGPDAMVMGHGTLGGGLVQEMTLLLARSVDLRRHRPGAAQHHR